MAKSNSMLGRLTGLLGGTTRTRVSPTETVGDIGVAIHGGMLVTEEDNAALQGEARYKTYSELLANVSIVAAATRQFLNLVAKAEWKFTPSEADTSGEFAELAEKMLTEDPDTSWHRIVRRAAGYRFYGFSVQEWTAKRTEDGRLTFSDVAPRAQSTIDRWDVDPETGRVRGIVQRSPNTFKDIYLPRDKCVYIVDDTLNDSPEGLGLFRHVTKAGRELTRLEKLESWGYETDLRGFPIARAPLSEINEKVRNNVDGWNAAKRTAALAPVVDFIRKHIKAEANNGLLLDSITYKTTDERQAPSNQYKFDAGIIQGSGSQPHESVHAAITRKTWEIARVLNGMGLLLGSDGSGSLALSKETSQNLSLVVDSTLKELSEGFDDDLLKMIWLLNGLDEDMRPTLEPESVHFKDVEAMAAAIRDLAAAGVMLAPDDPVVAEIYSLMGLSAPIIITTEFDAGLDGSTPRPDSGTLDDDVVPDRGNNEQGGEA